MKKINDGLTNKQRYYMRHGEQVKRRAAVHYRSHKVQRNQAVSARCKKQRDALAEYKSDKGCSTCGEKDSRCLDFHHCDSSKKRFSVALGCSRKPEILWAEVAKCTVLCSNCHRKLTYA